MKRTEDKIDNISMVSLYLFGFGLPLISSPTVSKSVGNGGVLFAKRLVQITCVCDLDAFSTPIPTPIPMLLPNDLLKPKSIEGKTICATVDHAGPI